MKASADENQPVENRPQALELMFDGPASGPLNMARDEALLEAACADGTALLRFYTWAQPTLSLGYFQPYAERHDHRASAECAVVRRPSGGGAIVHDQELTYCLVLPPWHALSDRPILLYRSVHQALVDTLRASGIQAGLRGDQGSESRPNDPLLCFLRHAEADVTVDGRKVAGSAQRRRRGAVLQHGSVLLARSPAAPELPGLCELTGKTVDRSELASGWADRLQQPLGLTARSRSPSRYDTSVSGDLLVRKYASANWTRRR